MKKYVFVIISVMMLLASCSDNKVEKFVERFTTAVNNNDKSAIEQMYPDAKKANGITLKYNSDSLRIESGGQQDEYMVTFAPNVWMRVAVGKNDSFVVKESKGLFSFEQSNMKFAKETGWYDDKLNDVENADRLSDEGFTDYLLKEFSASVKKGLKIINVGTWGDHDEEYGFYSDGLTFVVKNSSPYDISGTSYNILVKEGYWGQKLTNRETVPGQDVAAGKQVT